METNKLFQGFTQALHQALMHLFDPGYTAPPELMELISTGDGQPETLQSYLIHEIKKQLSSPDSQTNSRTQRSYTILALRFIDGLSQEQTAERLEMSLRTMQRAQRQAVLVLAYSLWNRQVKETIPTPEVWRSQLDQELSILSQTPPTISAELKAVLQGVKRITAARSPQRFELHIFVDSPLITTSFHPSVLQQIILSLLDRIMDAAPAALVSITVQTQDDDTVRIEVTGGQTRSTTTPEFPLVNSLLAMQDGCQMEVIKLNPLTINIVLPVVKTHVKNYSVFLVDDNADLGALYTSYCTGSPYDLVHEKQGLLALQRITTLQPDLIILDVMLPDVDGWELLLQLQANPVTSSIPVIVCSVVVDSQLALDLGAKLYLQKPVWRQPFLDALQSILGSDA